MMPAVPPAPAPPLTRKPVLPLARVIEMNLGFLGLQFSFGLQQGNMVPIYAWLGADVQRKWRRSFPAPACSSSR